jgi:large subunit ribosomal protein L28
MSRKCELTGKAVMSGHKVSHSQRKTKRKFLPNLHMFTLISDALGKMFRFRASTNALKTIEIKGGLDSYLLSAKSINLSKQAQDIKKQLVEKMTKGA